MAHIEDRWYRSVPDPDNPKKKVQIATTLHGRGLRYRVRYLDRDGNERSKSFPDRQKAAVQAFLHEIESDKRKGTYLDPNAGQVPFRTYAASWLASQTFEESTREAVQLRLDKHIFPHLGHRSLASITPTDVRNWDRAMEKLRLAPSYRQVMFIHIQTVLNAAVDDEKIRKNPCNASSVRKPQIPPRKIKPWTPDRVHAVHDAITDRYKIIVPLGAGLGLRQGEVSGSPSMTWTSSVTHCPRRSASQDHRPTAVLRPAQARQVPGRTAAGVGGGRDRRARQAVSALSDHAAVAASDRRAGDRPPDRLLARSVGGMAAGLQPVDLEACAGEGRLPAETARVDGFHALRHYYASTLFNAGETITALAEYLGHADPGFTLKAYTHLMPSSEERTRQAVDHAFQRSGRVVDGVATA